MDREGREFLAKEHLELWVWLRYIDDIFFVWTHRRVKFLERLSSFNPKLKSKCSRQKINFLDVTVKLNNNQFATDL